MYYELPPVKKSYSEMDSEIEKLTQASTENCFMIDDCCKPHCVAKILDPKYCYKKSLANAFYQAQSYYIPKNPS